MALTPSFSPEPAHQYFASAGARRYSPGMRVTGGTLGGRLLKVPKGDAVRPTQDMVRQALFSSFATLVPGSRFLDLFAGSGAVGLEAWSRGAAYVCWVESDPRAFRVLKENVETLCGPGGDELSVNGWKTERCDVFRFLEGAQKRGTPYNMIFAPVGRGCHGRNPDGRRFFCDGTGG
jgi:16S rRNA (guanine(966)-N(2))-methyltransferase RsmD